MVLIVAAVVVVTVVKRKTSMVDDPSSRIIKEKGFENEKNWQSRYCYYSKVPSSAMAINRV